MPSVRNHTGQEGSQGSIRITRESIQEIFPRYFERLVYFANQYLYDEEKARDAVHEMFLDLWEKREINEYKNERQLKTYLYLGTKSKAVNYQRKSEKEEKELKGLTRYWEKDHHPDEVDIAMTQAEAIARMRKAIEGFPPQCRTVMELLLKGHDMEEISQLLNMSPGAVRQNKFQGITALRKTLKASVVFYIALLLLGLHSAN